MGINSQRKDAKEILEWTRRMSISFLFAFFVILWAGAITVKIIENWTKSMHFSNPCFYLGSLRLCDFVTLRSDFEGFGSGYASLGLRARARKFYPSFFV